MMTDLLAVRAARWIAFAALLAHCRGGDLFDPTKIDAGHPDSGIHAPVSAHGTLGSLERPHTALDNVQICVHERPEIACVLSGTNGSYSMGGLPANEELILVFRRADLYPTLRMLSTGFGPPRRTSALTSSQTVARWHREIGATPDPGKGLVIIEAMDRSFHTAGVSATMEPMSGTGFYLDDMHAARTDLDQTSGAGVGVFANVDTGTATLTLTDPNRRCAAFTDTWPTMNGGLRARIEAGFITAAGAVFCP